MAYSPTALQLTHVLQQLFRRLGGVVTTATDGSTTLAIDTKFEEALGEGNVDDFLNGGTLIVLEDAGGANAAPEGEFSRINDYESGTTSITVDTLTAAIGSGDKFMYIGADFPLYDMIEVVNDALKYLGVIPIPDTSLTTAEDQTEYTLPSAIVGRDILNVEIQTITGDANDNQFFPVENWKVIPPTAPGGTATLVLPQLVADYTLRITYMGLHPKVTAYDDPISQYLHPDLVHAAVFAHAVQWKNDTNAVQGAPDNALVGLEQKAWSQFDRARILHPVHFPVRRIQGMPHWVPTTLKTSNNTYPPYYGV